MKEGRVKFFNQSKGYGFIEIDNGGEEVFVHKSGLVDTIHENDRVEFDTEQGRRGLNAVNVRRIN